jgi:hypothetical protein
LEELGYRLWGDFADVSMAHRSAERAEQNLSGLETRSQ